MSEVVPGECPGELHVPPPQPSHSHRRGSEWHHPRLGSHHRPQRTIGKDRQYTFDRYRVVSKPTHFQIPEPDVAIHSVNIDPDGAYLAAVNSKVCTCIEPQNNSQECRAHAIIPSQAVVY